jgi:Heterokaryon incompatibility protein (HET)
MVPPINYQAFGLGECHHHKSSLLPFAQSLRISMNAHERYDKLCGICRTIDFEKACFQSIPAHSLGTWRSIRESAHCPFCRLIIQTLEGQRPLHLDAKTRFVVCSTPAWKSCVMRLYYDGDRSNDYSNRYDLKAAAGKGESAHRLSVSTTDRHNRCTWELQYVPYHQHGQKRLFFGRTVDQKEVDWHLLRSWLRHCRKSHEGLCDKNGKSSQRRPENLRLIDIQERQIISAPKGGKFCAMTYVWGEGKRPLLLKAHLSRDSSGREHAALPQNLPRTIEDSMYVARQLRYDYLWNDSLCIVQDDDKDMDDQMGKMDAIYNCADLTIAAGSRDNAWTGLPGVSIPRAFRQKVEIIDGLCFAVPFPNYDLVQSNRELLPWNTRGWTLQEKLMSKRLLLFTDHQVYFKCANAIWSEDTVLEIDGQLSRDKRRRNDPFRWVSDRTPRKSPAWWEALLYRFRPGHLQDVDRQLGFLPNYVCVVEEYTKRTLKERSDAVKAIRGILNTLNDQDGHHFEFAGLPHRYLMEGLLWQPVGGRPFSAHSRAAVKAPSWSWAAWDTPDGCVWEPRDLKQTTSRDHLLSSFGFGKGFSPSTMWILQHEPNEAIPTTPEKGPQKLEKMPERPPQHVQECLQVVGHMLYFHTILVRFYIGRRIDEFGAYRHSEDDAQVACLYEITDAAGKCVGEIWTRPLEASAGKRYSRLFILLSFGKGFERAKVAYQYVPRQLHTIRDDTGINYGGRPQLFTPPNQLQHSRSTSHLPAQSAPLSPRVETIWVNLPPQEWVVGNVLLVEFKDRIARRVALGKIIKTALEKSKWKDGWVYLA